MIRAIELFAGAGGAALGLGTAGIEHAALVEWDASACATLRAAGLGPVVEGDVRNLDKIAAVAGEPVDLLWSSFPCQAWSSAGQRKGALDGRNGWPWTMDALDRFRPQWFLGENVMGLTHHRGGCGFRGGQEGLFVSCDPALCPGCYFERVILPDLRARFACVGWWALDAVDFGVPQHRKRVILWAGPRPLVEPRATHGPGQLPWVSMGDALAIGPNYLMHPCGTTAKLAGPTPSTEPAPSVTGAGNQYLTRPSPAVVCSEVKGSGPGGNPEKLQRASDALYLATGRRRLTIEECAILQGFPAGHPWQGTSEARYRQVGNAVPPRLAEVVGRALVDGAG